MKLLLWLHKAKQNKKGLSPLMMRITHGGQRINFPIHISIEEKVWDKDHQEILGNSDLIGKYNQYLLYLKTKAWEVYNDSLKADKPLTAQRIKDYILGNDASTYTLMETFDYLLYQLKARVGHEIAPGTVKNYEACRRKVEAFLQQRRLEDVFLSQLNYQFIQELDVFLRTREGLQNNGVAKHMQQLKRIIRVAMLNEWLSKDPFANYQCKLTEHKRVFLTREELQSLEQLSLPCERLEKVRDVFIFSCYSGLAYVDVCKLSAFHLQELPVTWMKPVPGR